MKVNFIIEETIRKNLTIDVPENTDPESLGSLAREEYDRIISNGKEIESCTVNSDYLIRCDECGDLVDPEEIYLLNGNAVCEACIGIAEKSIDLAKVGVNLGSIIDLFIEVLREYNNAKNEYEKENRRYSIMTFHSVLNKMGVTCTLIYNNNGAGTYTRVIIHGRSFTIE